MSPVTTTFTRKGTLNLIKNTCERKCTVGTKHLCGNHNLAIRIYTEHQWFAILAGKPYLLSIFVIYLTSSCSEEYHKYTVTWKRQLKYGLNSQKNPFFQFMNFAPPQQNMSPHNTPTHTDCELTKSSPRSDSPACDRVKWHKKVNKRS